ncbi:MAG: porin [Burkholderiaceae bacterium]|nr:porin [Burkholderiaceae bacterium]
MGPLSPRPTYPAAHPPPNEYLDEEHNRQPAAAWTGCHRHFGSSADQHFQRHAVWPHQHHRSAPNTQLIASTSPASSTTPRAGASAAPKTSAAHEALFRLEAVGSTTGIDQQPCRITPTAGLFNREAFVGLSSSFGTIRAGRITSPLYFATADYISMHNHDTGTSSDTLFNFNATGVNNNNMLATTTPDSSGTSRSRSVRRRSS